MLNKNIYSELILDGLHVSYPAAKILMDMKGYDKITFVTDSLAAAGLPEGKYHWDKLDIHIEKGVCRLEDGTIAGSIIGLNNAVYNAVKFLDVPLHEAVKMASTNIAGLLHENRGEIKEGKIADLIVFDDFICIKQAYVNGVLKYK